MDSNNENQYFAQLKFPKFASGLQRNPSGPVPGGRLHGWETSTNCGEIIPPYLPGHGRWFGQPATTVVTSVWNFQLSEYYGKLVWPVRNQVIPSLPRNAAARCGEYQMSFRDLVSEGRRKFWFFPWFLAFISVMIDCGLNRER